MFPLANMPDSFFFCSTQRRMMSDILEALMIGKTWLGPTILTSKIGVSDYLGGNTWWRPTIITSKIGVGDILEVRPGEGQDHASHKIHCCQVQMRRSQNWQVKNVRNETKITSISYFSAVESMESKRGCCFRFSILFKIIPLTLNLLGFLTRGPAVTATGRFSRELCRTRPFKYFTIINWPISVNDCTIYHLTCQR